MKNKIALALTLPLLLLSLLFGACGGTTSYDMGINDALEKTEAIPPGYGTTYEVFVYSFYDSDGDGIGDLPGLTSRLDYISDLGFDGIWLMPIMPSPTYHKYDVTDYYAIDPQYGTMADFEAFVAACHERGIRVIIDLVINHTSSAHPWFVEACQYLVTLDGGEPDAAICSTVDFYHFRRGLFAKSYPVPDGDDWYYEGQFWSGMPDLDLYNGAVRAEIENIVRFWFDKGVDGFRLDAAKEFVSGDHAANVEILTWFNGMVKSIKPDAYLVAEIWDQAPVYAAYYASGIDSIFNFAFAEKAGTIAATANGSRPAANLGRSLEYIDELFTPYNPDYIDAPFYSNHDQDRAAGHYSGEYAEAQTKTALALNLLMSGNTFTYYGDELGMIGAGRDENKRVAMYWSEDKNSPGMPRDLLNRESFAMIYPSYEQQKDDPLSIYNYVRNAIKIRNAHPEIIHGSYGNLDTVADGSLAAYVKDVSGGQVVILANLGADEVKLRLSAITAEDKVSAKRLEVAAVLLSGEDVVKRQGGSLLLPPFSIVILK